MDRIFPCAGGTRIGRHLRGKLSVVPGRSHGRPVSADDKRSPGVGVRPLMLSGLLLFAGCETNEGTSSVETLDQDVWSYVYSCDEGGAFSVQYMEDAAVVVLDGKRLELSRTAAGGTPQYEGGDYVLRLNGRQAVLDTSDERRARCAARPAETPWENAALRGVSYRGLGQEPGWYVEVTPDQSLLYVGDYGETVIMTGPPDFSHDGALGITTYTATSDMAQPLILRIEETPCSDTMSDEAFPTRAQIQVGAQVHLGCGRWLGGS